MKQLAQFQQFVSDMFDAWQQSKGTQDVNQQVSTPSTQRAISSTRVFDQLWDRLWERAEQDGTMYWPIDLYHDRGQMYAIVASDGRLYRIDVMVEDDNVMLGDEFIRVTEQFIPVGGAETIRAWQQPDGRVRWLKVSSTAVLNRVAEIDSTKLHQSFVDHARSTGEYPILNFAHIADIRLGQADYVARDGYCYITSGLFDDTPLGIAAGHGVMNDPEYWGDSIEFQSEQAVMMRIGEIDIPVYETGINTGIALLPEKQAASLFTNNQILRGQHMKQSTFDELVDLVGEELASQFADKVDGVNRGVDENGLIARTTDADGTQGTQQADQGTTSDQDTHDVDATETAVNDEDQDDTTQDTSPDAGLGEIVLDDTAIQAIAQAVIDNAVVRALTDKVSELEGVVASLQDQVNQAGVIQARGVKDITKRVEQLERSDHEKQATWVADLPRQRQTRVTVRPRDQHSDPAPKARAKGQRSYQATQTATARQVNGAGIAENTLSNLPQPKRHR